ncbi:GntR family transcriptional regulator [Roseomonas sp. E05]|uniref:GntR family transcriptional regulator n=1 Tax=Roseomonas sp. E05 TaxID=3046310 RepID=UPI0024BA9E0C|nr:GntR family transcriptional regulator [Roseomonas sp. E05]MDJ0390756.1 GntR family transcriptional regulator [Roseomonas sp. E05]
MAKSPMADAATENALRALETAIAHDIHAGLLLPGTWLKQIDLQERYGRSRGDVRRALDKLVAQRLVQQVHNSGYRVRPLDPKQLDELRQVRLILEGAAAETMLGRADAATLARLRNLAEGFSLAVEHRSILDQHEANQAFHAALLELCPNAELVRLVRETRLRLPSALLTQWHERGWVEESARHHHAMVDALEANDREAFCAVVRAHIRPSSRELAFKLSRAWAPIVD